MIYASHLNTDVGKWPSNLNNMNLSTEKNEKI